MMKTLTVPQEYKRRLEQKERSIMFLDRKVEDSIAKYQFPLH